MVWYSHLFQNFPQFIVIHTVKGFGIVNKAEIDVFLELSCFFHDPVDVGNFKYDLNQISYDYTVEVINRFKGLDLIVRVPEEVWTEVHNIVQEAVKKAKW